MKKNKIVIMLAVVALLLASLACNVVSGGDTTVEDPTTDNPTTTENDDSGFSVTTANITKAHLSLDADDTIPTDGYSPTDPGFYGRGLAYAIYVPDDTLRTQLECPR